MNQQPTTPETLVVGDLVFELRRSNRRRTVQVTVDRGGELVISAPNECPTSTMENFVKEKRHWIYTKLAEKEALRPTHTEKQYVTGEGFPYLGRTHRLLLVNNQDVPVKLEHGRFKMQRTAVCSGRNEMVRWYTQNAQAWLTKRMNRLKARVSVEPSGLTVKDLGYRWGSCGKGGRLYFHWRSILLPPSVIEYIVVHELVHLHEPHHTPQFWTRVERAMPDFAKRKQWLAENGGEAVGL
ncbi:MAG: SprT family zinc-dependent metalloprotease [Myxococcota bacterium]